MNFVLHSLIVHTLKKYIQNFETFQLSLFQGEIVLSKISTIQKSINQFLTYYSENIRIYKGNISKFKLLIPWSSLTSKSIQLIASEVIINLHFSYFEQLLQAEKSLFGIKEEIKYGVYPEVDESLIKKFLNRVINNLKVSLEKILINIDLLDIYVLQISLNELEIYNCKEDGIEYDYIQSKKTVSKLFILKEFRVKIISKTGKELELLKFDLLQIKIFIKKEQYVFEIKNLNDSVISLDLGLLRFFLEKIPEFFFKEKLKSKQIPIAFLLHNNIEMLKNSFQLKYFLEKASFNIVNNFEDEITVINQNINLLNLQIEYLSGASLQNYTLNFKKLELFSKGSLYLRLNSIDICDYMWKFPKLYNEKNFSNIIFQVNEKKQENSQTYQYDFSLIISKINCFLQLSLFLKTFKEILNIYQTIMCEINLFLAKIQEKIEIQRINSNFLEKDEKNQNLTITPKIIYEYSIKFLHNRIEIFTKLTELWHYFLYFSTTIDYKGILSRKTGLIKKFNLNIKPLQLRLENLKEIKILELVNSEFIYEKFEKKARISNIKLVICELLIRIVKTTISDLNMLIKEIKNENLFEFLKEKNNDKISILNKDYQFNIQVKIMNFNFWLGWLIFANPQKKEIFKEIFDLKLSKVELFSIDNASFKENNQNIPIQNYKSLRFNSKIEVFYIDDLFFESMNVLNKVNINFFYDFLDPQKNKLEFLNPILLNLNPEIINTILFLVNENTSATLIKSFKNETNHIIYLKYHHFIKNEEVLVLSPGQTTTLLLSNKKIDSHWNFYQIGRKFHPDDEDPFYSDKFHVSYDKNKSIKDFYKKVIVAGILPQEENVFHLKTINLEKSEVLCIFADWYLINLLMSQKLTLLSKTNELINNQNFNEIKGKALENCKDNQKHIENLLKSNNKYLDLEFLIQEKLFLNQYDYHSTIEDFLDTSNEYLFSNINHQEIEDKSFHIYFKKNSNFKFLTHKLYSKIENDQNPGKNLFYVDIFQIAGVNFSIIKPFILISNKTDKLIHLSLREYLNKKDQNEQMDLYNINPESFYSLCSSPSTNIFCTQIFFDFQIIHHQFNFQGQKIVYKTFKEEKTASNSHILQFSNENSFNFEVMLANRKIEESFLLEFDYPLEISNESEYVIIIKIKKFIDTIIIQPNEKCQVLKHLKDSSETLFFSILQKGDLLLSNTKAIEVACNDLFMEKINLLSFNFTKLNEDYLNIFLSLSLSSEPEKKQNLVIRPFLQINNRTDHSLVLAESNRIIKPNENFSLEFKFSCDEEYNNKFIKLSKEQIKTFCQNLIQNKFISEDIQNKGKVLKILLNSLDLKESKELSLNEMIRNNQLEIKFHSEIFVLGFYRNFFYHKKQLMFYLVKNLIHDNRNYILVSNQTANNIVYKNELQLIPFSSHLMFSDEKINTKSFKTSDLSDFQSEFNITSIILPCLKYHMIRNNNSDRISFQIIVPQISVKLCLEAENEINFDLEVHVRLFQNDKFDILINKFKIEKNSKSYIYEILSTQSPPYIIMEKSYYPEKNMMIFKNVYIKIDKLKLMIRNDTIAFLFKFLDQIYLLGGVITNGKTEENFQNIYLDLLTFVYNLKIEEYKINLNISLDPHLLLNDFNISIPVFKTNNQKSSIKNFLNEIASFYLAHFFVQLPKTSITLSQLKNPLNLITLIWNFKEKFMKSYSNVEENQLLTDSIQSISNIRFQLKYSQVLDEQLFLMLYSKKNSQSNSMKYLVLTNQFLYILAQGRVYKYIQLQDIKKIKWSYSTKVINITSMNTKDLELLTTLRNGYRFVNVMKDILI